MRLAGDGAVLDYLIVNNTNSNWMGLDDLTVNASVPEPHTLAPVAAKLQTVRVNL